jgi:hypothetical protein
VVGLKQQFTLWGFRRKTTEIYSDPPNSIKTLNQYNLVQVMSTDYWWLLCNLNCRDEEILSSPFESAIQKAIPSSESEGILQKWRNDPDNFLNADDIGESILLYNRFVWAFIFESFQKLGEELISPTGKDGFKLNENNCIAFINIVRCSPGAVLWHAVGPEFAERIPGYMGNIFLPKNSVPEALDTVLSIYGSLNRSRVREKISSLIQDSTGSENAEEALESLPKGLQTAKEQGHAFLALGMCAEGTRY